MTTARPATDFREALSRYGKVFGFLHSQAEIDIGKMTDEELTEFGVALDGPTQTNCGFEVYQVAKILRPVYDGEVLRRHREGQPR